MFPRWVFFYLSLTAACLAAAATDRFATVTIEPAKTSIYIGSVTMTMPAFRRVGQRYESSYVAKIVPYFFYNERGTLSIEFSDEQLARLGRGERVDFAGKGRNEAGKDRRIEGYATPANALTGKIKVRVFVSKTIELIFNTTYRFAPAER